MAIATTRPPTPVSPGTARVVPGDAAVTVNRGTPGAAADALLRAGDTISVGSGVATIRTAIGTLYAAAGSVISITGADPRIAKGDVLVEGKDVGVAMRAATAQITGIARVRQGLTLEVDVYRGAAVVRSASDTVGVGDLRRAIVSGNGSSLVTIAPLVVNADDTWDRKFLGVAIELDAALSARSRGFTMQVASGGADVMSKVIDATGVTDLTLLQNRPVGEVVVAAELARAVHLGQQGIESALKLRTEGASWGLIALQLGVRTLPASLNGVDNIVVPVGTAGSVAEVPTGETPVTTPAVKLPPVTVPTPTNTNPPPATGGSTDVTTPPVTVPPASNPVSTLVDGLDNLLGGLLGH